MTDLPTPGSTTHPPSDASADASDATGPGERVRHAGTRRQRRKAYRTLLRLMPPDGDLDELVAAVERFRGRPLRIKQVPATPGEPSGLWVPSEDSDVIQIDETAGPGKYAGTLFHELFHMFLRHDETPVGPPHSHSSTGDEDAAALREARVRRVFAQQTGTYADPHEYDSELLATKLTTEVRRRQRLAQTGDEISGRLR